MDTSDFIDVDYLFEELDCFNVGHPRYTEALDIIYARAESLGIAGPYHDLGELKRKIQSRQHRIYEERLDQPVVTGQQPPMIILNFTVHEHCPQNAYLFPANMLVTFRHIYNLTGYTRFCIDPRSTDQVLILNV